MHAHTYMYMYIKKVCKQTYLFTCAHLRLHGGAVYIQMYLGSLVQVPFENCGYKKRTKGKKSWIFTLLSVGTLYSGNNVHVATLS